MPLRRWCNRLYLGLIAGIVVAPANVMTQYALQRDIDWSVVVAFSLVVLVVFPLLCSATLARHSRG